MAFLPYYQLVGFCSLTWSVCHSRIKWDPNDPNIKQFIRRHQTFGMLQMRKGCNARKSPLDNVDIYEQPSLSIGIKSEGSNISAPSRLQLLCRCPFSRWNQRFRIIIETRALVGQCECPAK